MLKRRNMKKMLGIGSLCLFLLGCSEESFLIQKDSSSILLEDETAVSEEELQISAKDVEGPSKEILEKSKEEITEQKLTEDVVVTEVEQKAAEIAVHICGAVKQPGVYYLKENQRLHEGIEKAGGFREDAEENYLNQALVLEDGMQIIVPTKEEVRLEEKLNTESQKRTDIEDVSDSYILSQKSTEELAAESGYLQKKDRQQKADGVDVSEKQNGKVNLNTADETLLCTLPGIGESRAKSIIAYRQEHGLFQTPEDVMKVSGIKQAAYEKMKDYVTVSD